MNIFQKISQFFDQGEISESAFKENLIFQMKDLLEKLTQENLELKGEVQDLEAEIEFMHKTINSLDKPR